VEWIYPPACLAAHLTPLLLERLRDDQPQPPPSFATAVCIMPPPPLLLLTAAAACCCCSLLHRRLIATVDSTVVPTAAFRAIIEKSVRPVQKHIIHPSLASSLLTLRLG
jgi:hypothetical protein